MELKARLQQVLDASNLSDEEIASRIGTGLSDSTVRRWRKEKTIPRLDEAVALARALGFSIAELVGEVRPFDSRSPSGHWETVLSQIVLDIGAEKVCHVLFGVIGTFAESLPSSEGTKVFYGPGSKGGTQSAG